MADEKKLLDPIRRTNNFVLAFWGILIGLPMLTVLVAWLHVPFRVWLLSTHLLTGVVAFFVLLAAGAVLYSSNRFTWWLTQCVGRFWKSHRNR